MKISERLQAIKQLQSFLNRKEPCRSRNLTSREFLEMSMVDDDMSHHDWQNAFDKVLSLIISSFPSVPERLFYRLSFLAIKLKDFELVTQINLYLFENDAGFDVKQLNILLGALTRIHEYSQTIDTYKAFIEKHPERTTSEETSILYAKAMNGLGEALHALAHLDSIKTPQDKHAYLICRALCLRSLNRFEETIEIYDTLVKEESTHTRLYCARQYSYLGMYAKCKKLMESLIEKDPKNVNLMTEYVKCLFRMPDGRGKALEKCREFLRIHADDLNLEELKDLYLLKAWYSSQDSAIHLYQQLRLRHPNDLLVLKQFIQFTLYHGLDELTESLKQELNETYQIEIEDILQRPLLKETLNLMNENPQMHLETSFSNQNIFMMQEVKELMSQVQDGTRDEIYLVGSTVIDLLTSKAPVELKDVDLICLSNRQKFPGFMPNPHITNYYTRISTKVNDFESGLIVVNTKNSGTNFLRENILNRDFTICALFATIEGKVFDPTGKGFLDLKNRILRTIINSSECLEKHPVRFLRAIKYLARGYFPSEELYVALKAFKIYPHLENPHFMQKLKSLMDSPNFELHLNLLLNYQQLPLILEFLEIPFGLHVNDLRQMIISKINQKKWNFKDTTIDVNLTDQEKLQYLQVQVEEHSSQHAKLLDKFDVVWQSQHDLQGKLSRRQAHLKALIQESQTQICHQSESLVIKQQISQAHEDAQKLKTSNTRLKKIFEKQEDKIQKEISDKLKSIQAQFRHEKQRKTDEIRRLDGHLLQIHKVLLKEILQNKALEQNLVELENQQEKLAAQNVKKTELLQRFQADLASAPTRNIETTKKKHPLLSRKNFYSSGQFGLGILYRYVTLPSLRKAMHLEIIRIEMQKTERNIYKIMFHLQAFYDFDNSKIPQVFQNLLDEKESSVNLLSVDDYLLEAKKCYNALLNHQAHYYYLKALEAAEKDQTQLLKCIIALGRFYLNQNDLILFDKLYQNYLARLTNNTEFHQNFNLLFDEIRENLRFKVALIDSEFPSRRQEHYWWMLCLQKCSFFKEIGIFENESKKFRAYLSGIYDQSENLEELALVSCFLNNEVMLNSLIQKSPTPHCLQFFKNWFEEQHHPEFLPKYAEICLDINTKKVGVSRHILVESQYLKPFSRYSSEELNHLYEKAIDPFISAHIAFVLLSGLGGAYENSSAETSIIPLCINLFQAKNHPEFYHRCINYELMIFEEESTIDWSSIDTKQLFEYYLLALKINDMPRAQWALLMLLDIEPYSLEGLEKLLVLYLERGQFGNVSKMLTRIHQLLPYYESKAFLKCGVIDTQVSFLKDRIKRFEGQINGQKQEINEKIMQIRQSMTELEPVVSLDKKYRQLQLQLIDLYWESLNYYSLESIEEYMLIMQKISQMDRQLGYRYGFANLHLALHHQNKNPVLANCHMKEALELFMDADAVYLGFELENVKQLEFLNSSFYFQLCNEFKRKMETSFTFNYIDKVLLALVKFGRPDIILFSIMNHIRNLSIAHLVPQHQFYLSMLTGQQDRTFQLFSSYSEEILHSKRLGWVINRENVETFFKNRHQFLIDSNACPQTLLDVKLDLNIYNELIHTALLQNSPHKADLNFKLGINKFKNKNDRLLNLFLQEYQKIVLQFNQPQLIESAIAYITKNEANFSAPFVEYAKSLQKNQTANTKIGGLSK